MKLAAWPYLCSFVAAIVVEAFALQIGRLDLGPSELSQSPPIEAFIAEAQPLIKHLQQTHLQSQSQANPERVQEKAIGRTSSQINKAAPAVPDNPQNQVTAGAEIPTHGPSIVYSPSPEIPPGLRGQTMAASCLIQFTIEADGSAFPELIRSSGEPELDALALKTARTWRFSPAIQDNHAIRSRLKLRVNFTVK